jgi:hypothetical protein
MPSLNYFHCYQDVCRGRTLPLDASGVNEYSIFPGQIILSKATNPNGSKIVASTIWSDASGALPTTKIRLNNPNESLDVVTILFFLLLTVSRNKLNCSPCQVFGLVYFINLRVMYPCECYGAELGVDKSLPVVSLYVLDQWPML